MKCDEFMGLIDAYIDGDLDSARTADMHTHARECEKCASELEFAKLLRDSLKGMDDNVVPPLAAQAAWRNAIKAESRARKMRRIYKYCGTAAAALVVMIGGIVGIRAIDGNNAVIDTTAPAQKAQGYAFVESDGDEATPTAMARTISLDEGSAQEVVTASAKLVAADIAAACDAIISIAGEYDGSAEVQNVGGNSAYITAYIPAGSIMQFMGSLDYAGEITESSITGEDGETITVSISIKTAE